MFFFFLFLFPLLNFPFLCSLFYTCTKTTKKLRDRPRLRILQGVVVPAVLMLLVLLPTPTPPPRTRRVVVVVVEAAAARTTTTTTTATVLSASALSVVFASNDACLGAGERRGASLVSVCFFPVDTGAFRLTVTVTANKAQKKKTFFFFLRLGI